MSLKSTKEKSIAVCKISLCARVELLEIIEFKSGDI